MSFTTLSFYPFSFPSIPCCSDITLTGFLKHHHLIEGCPQPLYSSSTYDSIGSILQQVLELLVRIALPLRLQVVESFRVMYATLY